jgi:hypothetical protein
MLMKVNGLTPGAGLTCLQILPPLIECSASSSVVGFDIPCCWVFCGVSSNPLGAGPGVTCVARHLIYLKFVEGSLVVYCKLLLLIHKGALVVCRLYLYYKLNTMVMLKLDCVLS